MKWLIALVLLVGCVRTTSIKDRCSAAAIEKREEVTIFGLYQEEAKDKLVCYGILDMPLYYVDREYAAKQYFQKGCKPMPEVVKVKAFHNCQSGFTGYLVFFSDGHVIESVRRPDPDNQ